MGARRRRFRGGRRCLRLSPLSSSDAFSIRSARPSAIASSLAWMASSLRRCEFCNSATKRNVTIVVAVLITNCHVLRLLKTK